jgi:hypothetical protein
MRVENPGNLLKWPRGFCHAAKAGPHEMVHVIEMTGSPGTGRWWISRVIAALQMA